MAKRLGNIKLSEAAFFLCDMQERFRPGIKYFSEILEVSKRLVSCHCDGRKTGLTQETSVNNIGSQGP